MIKLGTTARYLREMHGLNQKAAAEELGVTVVHLCNIEKDRATPSPRLMERYRECWGIDLYILAWCLHGDMEKLPESVREPMAALAEAWQDQLRDVAVRCGTEVRSCSTSDK